MAEGSRSQNQFVLSSRQLIPIKDEGQTPGLGIQEMKKSLKHGKAKENGVNVGAAEPEKSRNYSNPGGAFKQKSQPIRANKNIVDQVLSGAAVGPIKGQKREAKASASMLDGEGSPTREGLGSKKGSPRRAADAFSEPSMAKEVSKLTRTQPNFLKQLKRNTHIDQAINHAYKLDYRNSISIESDNEGMFGATGGLQDGAQLPFLISKASNFFQAT